MRNRVQWAGLLLSGLGPWLGAQDLPLPQPVPSIQLEPEAVPQDPANDPLEVPPELWPIIHRATGRDWTVRSKLQGILDAFFRPESEGGLGLTYDNSRTRTIREVLQEHRANCISLTNLYVASCRIAGLPAHYAEPLNFNHWRREGSLIRMERHVVALISMFPQGDLVADFLPRVRQNPGTYLVRTLPPERVRALFHSNRAVELLQGGQKDLALAHMDQSLKDDPTCSVAWNIRGVVLQYLDRFHEAEECYRTALSLDPKDSAAVGNMESLMRMSNHLAEARRYRELGLDLRKKDPYFQAFLAEEAMDAQQWEEASRLVAAAIELQPYESSFYLLKVRLELQAGKPTDAVKAMELARRWALPAERERYDNKLALLKKSQS